jgi:hypothetical protein
MSQDEEPTQWLAENSIDFQRTLLAAAPVQITDHAWFNSETGALAISTEIYPPCNECELPSQCQHFPRNGVISCMTGDGDGDYLVWALHGASIPEDAPYFADGAFIILDSSIHASHKFAYGKLLFDAPPLTPISLGLIEVKEYISSTGPTGYGFLFVSDQQATANSEFFIVDLPLKPGRYQIIAFMGEAMFYDFTPRAIGIYGEFFEASLIDTLTNLDHKVSLKFADQIHGTEDGTVLSRLGNDLDNLAEKNSAITYNRSVMLSDSWGFQRYFAGSQVVKDRIENFSPSSEYTALQWLTVADELRMRGQKAQSTKIINEILASSLILTGDEDKYLVAIMRANPGVWPA